MLAQVLDTLDVRESLGHTRGSVILKRYGRVLAGRRVSGIEQRARVMEEYSDTSWVYARGEAAG